MPKRKHVVEVEGFCDKCKKYDTLTKYKKKFICRDCLIDDDTRYMPAPHNMFERLGDC